MGLCEGVPGSITPNHAGRADYHGASVNQAARFMDAGGRAAVEGRCGGWWRTSVGGLAARFNHGCWWEGGNIKCSVMEAATDEAVRMHAPRRAFM